MNEALRKVCRDNLLMALGRLKQHVDPTVVAQATMAEVLFLDLESSEQPAQQANTPESVREYNDSTNYEKYKLLRSFGLSVEQLIDVAKADGLHQLRIVRMMRLTFELSLDEATKILNSNSSTG